jgi:hypothetical protein
MAIPVHDVDAQPPANRPEQADLAVMAGPAQLEALGRLLHRVVRLAVLVFELPPLVGRNSWITGLGVTGLGP